MLEFLNNLTHSEERSILVVQMFVIVFVTVLANFIAGKIINSIAKRAEKSKTLWDDALVFSLRKPVRLMMWVIGLTLAMEFTFSSYQTHLLDYIKPIREVGVIFSLTWFSLRFIKSIERDTMSAKPDDKAMIKYDRTTVNAVAKLLRISVIITSILIVMQSLGFSVTGVMAFGGIGGMAVALAAKDMLANFFGALMIYFDKPFKVGDWIRSPDQEIEGTVEDIGWRRTVIRTFDKRPLYVPNSVFTHVTVENPSRMTNRRIKEYFGIRYDDMAQVNAITKDVEAMLQAHDEIDTKQTLMVHLDRFAPSSVDFFIYTFTKTTNWVKFHGVKQDVMLKVADIITKHGAEAAYPTQTLHVPNNIGFDTVSEVEKSTTKIE
jgi:MscS family membrane protein